MTPLTHIEDILAHLWEKRLSAEAAARLIVHTAAPLTATPGNERNAQRCRAWLAAALGSLPDRTRSVGVGDLLCCLEKMACACPEAAEALEWLCVPLRAAGVEKEGCPA